MGKGKQLEFLVKQLDESHSLFLQLASLMAVLFLLYLKVMIELAQGLLQLCLHFLKSIDSFSLDLFLSVFHLFLNRLLNRCQLFTGF